MLLTRVVVADLITAALKAARTILIAPPRVKEPGRRYKLMILRRKVAILDCVDKAVECAAGAAAAGGLSDRREPALL